ncbi:hypothetical protein, partial [Prosthecobacter sp.]|uniref:hypothetical protein n=1 Tax=Prosthecobacter sp. TaxID=1965333 RepID=UPI0037C735F7
MLEIQRINQELIQHPKYSKSGWIGVDLDGTLARSDPAKSPNYIGAPVPQMIKRVRYWIKTGRTVKIFTSRAGDPDDEIRINQWCVRHGLPELEITNRKDHKMLALWDHRAVGLVRNLGVPILPVKMSLWQSLRLRLLLLMGSNVVMKIDQRQLQGHFHAALKTSRGVMEYDGN